MRFARRIPFTRRLVEAGITGTVKDMDFARISVCRDLNAQHHRALLACCARFFRIFRRLIVDLVRLCRQVSLGFITRLLDSGSPGMSLGDIVLLSNSHKVGKRED